MAILPIDIGTAPNSGDGDPLRAAMQKANANFLELYNRYSNAVSAEELVSLASKEYVDGLIAALVDDAPAALNTLKELATAIGNNPSFASDVAELIAAKADADTVTAALSGLSIALSQKAVGTVVDAALLLKQNLEDKGEADGYAPLDGNAKVPAAHLDIGTTSGKLVMLDLDGRLPAIDGSLLINLPGSGDGPIVDMGDVVGLDTALANKQDISVKGTANGYAGLDGAGKVPTAQLPDAVLGALSYQGVWNASTNSPAIPSAASGNKGHYYLVTTAGTTAVNGIDDWQVGDWIVSNGGSWNKCDNTDAVAAVAGLTGSISASALKAALAIAIGDVSGLQAALDAKAATTFAQNADNLTAGTVGNLRLPERLRTVGLLVADWDLITTTGWYFGNTSTVNGPAVGNYLGFVEANSSNYVTQTLHNFTTAGPSDSQTWRRHRVAGVWSAWYKLQLSRVEQDARYEQIGRLAGVTAKTAAFTLNRATDIGKHIRLASASNFTGTIPHSTSAGWVVGDWFSFSQEGAGVITFSPAANVNLFYKGRTTGIPKTNGQFGGGHAVYLFSGSGNDYWNLFGDLGE